MSILPIITTICLRKFSQVRHQHQLSDWLRRYNKSTTNRIQTPLLRFVVDSDLLYNKSTTSRHVEMLWICCRRSICRGFVVDLFVVQLVVQQIHNKSNKWSLGITAAKIAKNSNFWYKFAPKKKSRGSIEKLEYRCTTRNLPLCNGTIIVLKITLLHSVCIITNFVIPKRDKKNKKNRTKKITLFHLQPARDPYLAW